MKSHWPREASPVQMAGEIARDVCGLFVQSHAEHQRSASFAAAGRSAITAQLLAAAEMN